MRKIKRTRDCVVVTISFKPRDLGEIVNDSESSGLEAQFWVGTPIDHVRFDECSRRHIYWKGIRLK